MDKKYWDILLSKEYGKIHALMQTLSEESLSDPTRIERVFRSLGIDDDGSICVPDDAPEGYEQAPHLAAFLHWKKGFLEAQRVRQTLRVRGRKHRDSRPTTI